MRSKEIFLISLSIFLTICAWLLFDIYNISRVTSKQIEKEYDFELVRPLKIEVDILKKLNTKE